MNDIARRPERDELMIVGLGASAGGIAALKRFFQSADPNLGTAYVAILHMSPQHESHLASVLQSATRMKVLRVEEQSELKADCVYVISPKQSLSIVDNRLVVSQIHTIEERRAPVDVFFRTLAAAKGPAAVAVILSGTGANGSSGLKRVKEFGGCVFAQDPEQAEYTDMPKNAIATGHVDQVLPAEQIPAKIAAYKSHLHLVIPVGPDGAVEADEHAMRDILIQLRRHTGHDFSTYKRSTLVRRIERRMSIHEVEALSKYAWYLREHPEEIGALLGDLLISVTNFFRDKEAFEAIKKNVIPRLFENRSAGDTIRVWIAGCATGEEAYSIAMLLMEAGAESLSPFGVQLFATDIDREAIAHARQGFYTETATADISPERLIPFFTKEPDGYRVRKELRERILFAVHDLVKDPPFSRLDLVCCRNLLIYLNRSGQQRVLNTLHFALQPNGFLFTGSAESPDSAPELFVAFDKENGIFQARALEAQQPLSFPRFPFSTEPINRNVLEPAAQHAAQRLSFADLHLKLLEEYAPPSVVINEDYEIVHMTERAANYMQLPGGEPTHNLLKVIVPALRLELRSALYQATQKRTFVEARAVKLSETRAVNLIVRPVFRTGDSARGFILVVFQETGAGDGAERVQLAEPIAGQLEDELMRAKGQLVSTMEQHEAQTQELRASNEELQAANEELLSASQEMEVSREELQSINEELTTVNQELKVKIDELSHANDDFQNLINSTDIGTIFLDPALKVKSFTPRATEVFHLIPTDRGRALSDITSKIEYERLFEDAERVLDYLQPVEHEVQTREGRWYLIRVLPYRTLEDRIDGVVMTFLDLTSRKESEEALRKSEERFRSIVSQAAAGVAETDLKGNFTLVNQKYCEIMGYSEAELLEMKLWDITYPEDLPRNLELFERLASDGTPFAIEKRYVRKDRSLVWVSNNVSVIRDAREKPHSALALVYDVTERKRADAELLGLKNELGTDLSAMTRLHDLSTRLFAASELQPLLEEVLEAAMQLQGADFGNIQLYNAKTGALEIVAQRGFDQEFLDHFSEVHEGQPSRGVSLQRRERVIIEDIQTDPLYAASHETAARAGYRAVQSTPLFSRAGEALGVLSTAFRQRHKPSERELRLTDLYARVAAEMIDRKQAEQALRVSEDRYRRTAEELAATNEKLEQKVDERTHLAEQRSRQLRSLALELTQAEAKERRRIAQILHDALQQLIIAAKYKLQAIGGKKKDFKPVFDLLDDGVKTARTLAAEIAPPALYKSNFVTALEWIADKAKQQHGLATEISSSRRQIALSDAQKVFLYEATRELLLNAAKHSRAKRVRLRWGTCSNCAILRVADDGVGFSAMEQKSDSGFGLFSIRERLKALGGGMVIRSRAKRGTQVALVLPLRRSRKRNSVRARKQ